MQHPRQPHLEAAFHVLKYLKGYLYLSKGIYFLAQKNFQLTTYCDADWAAYPISKKFITGFCVFLGSTLLSWKAKKQATVSRSLVEAKYRSMR